MKTVRDYSEALKRRELEGAPLLRERGETLVLLERPQWAFSLVAVVFLMLGGLCVLGWFISTPAPQGPNHTWILPVLGLVMGSLAALMGSRSEVYCDAGLRRLNRRTFLLGVLVRDRRVALDCDSDYLVLVLSWAHHRGNTLPSWSLEIPRPTCIDTLLMGYCTHAAAEEVIDIFAEVTGLRIEVDRSRAS